MKEYKKWEIAKGEYRLDEEGVVAGYGIAKRFTLSVGDVVTIRGKAFRIRGILAEVGNRDDRSVYLDLPVAQALHGVGDKVSFVSVLERNLNGCFLEASNPDIDPPAASSRMDMVANRDRRMKTFPLTTMRNRSNIYFNCSNIYCV